MDSNIIVNPPTAAVENDDDYDDDDDIDGVPLDQVHSLYFRKLSSFAHAVAY